jgi:hypothetical protein
MSILSTIQAAVSVGPYRVVLNNSVYYVGPWIISADGYQIGPYPIAADDKAVGPYPWRQDVAGNYWLGPWIVA